MPQNPLPEMLRLSLATLGLRIKIMKLKLGTSIEDVLSKALDPPSSVNIQRAVSSLVEASTLSGAKRLSADNTCNLLRWGPWLNPKSWLQWVDCWASCPLMCTLASSSLLQHSWVAWTQRWQLPRHWTPSRLSSTRSGWNRKPIGRKLLFGSVSIMARSSSVTLSHDAI